MIILYTNNFKIFKLVSYNFETGHSLVECKPLTGRTHQIRLHLQYLGHPIVNDPLYGSDCNSYRMEDDICFPSLTYYPKTLFKREKNLTVQYVPELPFGIRKNVLILYGSMQRNIEALIGRSNLCYLVGRILHEKASHKY
jgi:hypothetical protein